MRDTDLLPIFSEGFHDGLDDCPEGLDERHGDVLQDRVEEVAGGWDGGVNDGNGEDAEETGEFEVHGQGFGPVVNGLNERWGDASLDFEGFCG